MSESRLMLRRVCYSAEVAAEFWVDYGKLDSDSSGMVAFHLLLWA